MGVPNFDESTRADKLASEVFRWLCEASMYVRSTPASAADVYDVLKLVLRLVAVRNPDSQSHAIRRALGSLIEAIYEQPGSENVCLDLLGLLIRVVDAKQSFRYNPMKHLAIAGLGFLSQHMRIHMRQMTANVFIICTNSFRVMPADPAIARYRNTILWTLGQSAASSIDEGTAKIATKLARTFIENADESEVDAEGVCRAFDLLSMVLQIPAGRFLGKKMDSLYTLFSKHGISSTHATVREAAARCYGTAILNYSSSGFRHDLEAVVTLTIKTSLARDSSERLHLARMHGFVSLLEHLLDQQPEGQNLANEFNDWMAALLLQLDVKLAHKLIIDVLVSRKLVSERLRLDALGVLLRLLGSAAQAPTVPKTKLKTKHLISQKPEIASTLSCISGIVSLLGGAVLPVADPVHQVSLGLVLNNMGANISGPAALAEVVNCLVVVVRNVPSLLIPTIEICLKQLEAERAPARQKQALAYVLSTMVAESRHFPLYGAVELNAQVLLVGADLVKRRENFASYSVAWTLFAGIMALGPNVVRPHMPQFLLMWESYLSLDACRWQPFIERALTALAAFMTHNQPLLTTDVAKRIGKILHGVWSATEMQPPDQTMRRRLLQCYELLLQVERSDIYPSSLLMKYVAYFSSAASYSKDSGVEITSAMSPASSRASTPNATTAHSNSNVNTSGSLQYKVIYEPKMAVEFGLAGTDQNSGAISNDLDFFLLRSNPEQPLPLDVYTTIVDSAIAVSSKMLPLQPHRIQESVLDAILTNTENAASMKSPRKFAVIYNVAKLIKQTLSGPVTAEERECKVIVAIIKQLLFNENPQVRDLAAESAGRLAKNVRSFSSQIITSFVKEIIDSVVRNNSDVSARSGAILALGYVVEERPQSSLLEAVYKVLMPLAADPTPEIHLAVLKSLRHTLTTSDLVDQRYVKLALKTANLRYLLESPNNGLAFETEIAKTLIILVSNLGPDLSTPTQEASLHTLVRLADQVKNSRYPEVRAIAWKAFIELYYYARQGVNWMLIIRKWRDIATDQNAPEIEVNAMINGLLMLMRLSARSILAIAGNGLEEALWLLLDRQPQNESLRLLFITWMEQTSRDAHETANWIRRLQSIVMKPRYFFADRLEAALKPSKVTSDDSRENNAEAQASSTAVAADEDVSLGAQVDEASTEQFVWEARVFALELLLLLLRIDLVTKETEERSHASTTRSVGDIVKISFSAATSQVLPMQYAGLALLNELIYLLGDQKDPDFPQISLLEQFQVQIISALSPAFSKESSPALALAALQACGTFLSSSVVKTKEKLMRPIKTLTEALKSIDSPNGFKLGSLEMSPDAAALLKIAVLRVWAQIEIQAAAKPHLGELINSLNSNLVPLWTNTLRDYGSYTLAGEDEWSLTSLSSSVDQMKTNQLRLLLMPVYETSRLDIISALATLILSDSVDKKLSLDNADFSMMLCGLCLEALTESLHFSSKSASRLKGPHFIPITDAASTRSTHRSHETQMLFSSSHQGTTSRLEILRTLEKILIPSISTTILHGLDGIFEETIAILYRAMLIGSPEEQMSVITIARNLATGQIETDESVDYLIDILKVAMLPLRHLFPQLFGPDTVRPSSTKLSEEQLELLKYTLDALIDIAQVFREIIQTDLWICLLKVFEEVNHCHPAIAAPSFKRLLEILALQVEQRGIAFIVDALTFSLRHAVDVESTPESLLISTAIVCTNYKSLDGPVALQEIVRFGTRAANAAMVLVETEEVDEPMQKQAATAIRCINAVLNVCSTSAAGHSFAYACLPAMVVLSASARKVGSALPKGACDALTTYAMACGTPEVFAFVIPSLLHLEADETWLSADQRKVFARQRLLQFVAAHPLAFKQIVLSMDSDREVLQQLLVQSSLDQTEYVSDEDEDEEGEITLKSFV